MLYSILYCGNISIVGRYALIVEGTVTSGQNSPSLTNKAVFKCWTGNWVLLKPLQSSMRHSLKASSLTYKELKYV